MDKLTTLALFFDKAAKDCRITIAHIGLYATLLQMLSEQGFEGPLETYSAKVMQLAKISSTATYHKLIRDLYAYGYLGYKPSYNKRRGSRIYLKQSNSKQ